METRQSGIYSITNSVNSRVYIGSTVCFKSRKRQHFNELKSDRHKNPKLQNFVNKYGLDSLTFNILEYTVVENLRSKEQVYLDTTSDKFNICVKSDRPNVKRNFTKTDIENIASLYNSGKCSTQIAKLYFGTKSRQNYITSIIKGEIYTECNYLFKPYVPKTNRVFSKDQILRISELYNSGKTGCQIAEILYDNRNKRALINSLITGKTYKEYSHLFETREYNQVGRVCKDSTKNKIGEANKGSRSLSEEDIQYIEENLGILSGRKIAFTLGKSPKSIYYYINKIRKNGL